MKKVLVILIGLLFTTQSVLATSSSNEVVNNFILALVKNNDKLAKSYVSSNVKIPEIRENTPIRGFMKLSSPKENVKVSITYFDDGENEPERIAFIWEITSNKEKITNIRVVYDGSNPLMNESKVVNEYEAKFQNKILVPSEFPFDITHVNGYVYKDELMLRYRNENINGLLQISVVPNDVSLEGFGGRYDKFYTLKNGAKALYQPNFGPAQQLIFQHKNLKYSIGISRRTEKKITVDDLLKIANSML
ncbi:hypothetical protein [Bacillus dakarensis]|uniref:hypothetical protein n=1 Tax=Robertmurraya dakarensis TaxID=1926278 RepID=UPI0009810495|nr:hypothetical protein [Bacillus dakarensis]